MLIWLTKTLRFHAAIALTAVYAACVIAPALALAFADSAAAAPCLTGDHHGVTQVHTQSDAHSHGVHVHGDGMAQKHSEPGVPVESSDSKQKSRVGACCGLLCFTAVTVDLGGVIGQPVHASATIPELDAALSGRGPDRIDRPPSTTLMSL
jgi:hypothetical protein